MYKVQYWHDNNWVALQHSESHIPVMCSEAARLFVQNYPDSTARVIDVDTYRIVVQYKFIGDELCYYTQINQDWRVLV